MQKRWKYELAVTTQGPTYPPSEVMDEKGNYIVIGRINRPGENNTVIPEWGSVLVSRDSETPPFGEQRPYKIIRTLDLNSERDKNMVLYTLPLPLPNNNVPIVFAPDQLPQPWKISRPSQAFHEILPPDSRVEDGIRSMHKVVLGDWVKATGELTIELANNKREATFMFEFANLIPDTVYTVMSLREQDLAAVKPSRPGPLGIPNVFCTDRTGNGNFWATLPNPFPPANIPGGNRIINVILLWMSHRMSYGGAIGLHGLGGDVHAQLKMPRPSFYEIETRP